MIEATETADTTDDVEPDVLRDDADELVVDATAAREEGDLETAITLYDEALDLYKAAVDEIDDEDRSDELKETIAQTNSDLKRSARFRSVGVISQRRYSSVKQASRPRSQPM